MRECENCHPNRTTLKGASQNLPEGRLDQAGARLDPAVTDLFDIALKRARTSHLQPPLSDTGPEYREIPARWRSWH
jgi:hypothetical protein